jgi:hypothetical protein
MCKTHLKIVSCILSLCQYLTGFIFVATVSNVIA